MKSKSLTCLKYLVFIFNLLIFICGIAALSVGIWALVNGHTLQKLMGNSSYVFTGIYIVIAVGSSLFLIGFLGCCGAIKENKCMLGTFFAIILVLFITQLAAAIFIYVKRGAVTKAITASIGKYGDGSKAGTAIQQAWDSFQKLMKCCGVHSYHDWKTNSKWSYRHGTKVVPDSCCKQKGNTWTNLSQCQMGDATYLYTDGCIKKVSKSIKIVAIVASVILAVEVLAMIFSCCLCRHANDYSELA